MKSAKHGRVRMPVTAASIRLPGGRASNVLARQFVRTQLGAWSLRDPSGDALILASELVSNAVLHGGGAVAIRLARTGEGLRIGTVRRPPRGVRKADFARLDWYDVWYPVLAPGTATMKLGLGSTTERQGALSPTPDSP